MKKINALNLARLRTEEDFGFMKLVKAETAALSPSDDGGESQEAKSFPSPALEEALNGFNTAFDAFDAALKAAATLPATSTAAAADESRDQSWRGINAFVKSMCVHPSADVAAQAKEVKSLFDKYGDPTMLPQTEESGVLHNLLQDLAALDSSLRTALYLDTWIDDLKAKEDAYLAAVAERTVQEAARQVGIVKEKRNATDAAYRSLTDTVNALVTLEGDAAYATFIDHINALIDRQKTVLKARKTKGAKEDTPAAQ